LTRFFFLIAEKSNQLLGHGAKLFGRDRSRQRARELALIGDVARQRAILFRNGPASDGGYLHDETVSIDEIRSAVASPPPAVHSDVTLSRSVVMELIEKRPAVAVAMLQQMADMVRRTTGVATDMVFLDLAQRVAKFLLEGAAQPSNEIRTTQSELAPTIGASRQRVSACLQEFQRDEWISLAPKSIRLRNPDALRRLMSR
jgi:hypothetical protein